MSSIRQTVYDNSRNNNNDGDVDNAKEEEDTLGPLCTCGQLTSSEIMMEGELKSSSRFSVMNSNNNKKNKSPTWLESSFVHLMIPRSNNRASTNRNNDVMNQQQQSHGFLEQHQHLLQLLDAAHGVDNASMELCMDCIDRVAAALEADTQRLYGEVQAYQETVQASQQRVRALQNHRHQRKSNSDTNDTNMTMIMMNPLLDFSATEAAYQQEIEMLKEEVQAKQDDLDQLKSLFREHMEISKHLDVLEDNMQFEQNSLELQSQSFDNRRHVLTETLSEVQSEVDKLTVVSLPRMLFDLQVDPRGLRYPLINQLRLAFRPKGDVPVKEIHVAWSQATQLLLILGTLLNYPSVDWKVVPLSDCAKLIYRKEIFNLSPGDCRSLMAWNALLDQVVKHALVISTTAALSTTTRSHSSSDPNQNNINSSNHHQYIQNYYHAASRKLSMSSHNNKAPTSSPSSNCYNNSAMSPPFSSSPTTIGDTELARLDPMDHFGWSQVIHRMASNLLWVSDRASELAAMQVSSTAHCVV